MNTFTNKADFIEDAQFILDNSELLIKSDCRIVDGVLYERLGLSNIGNEPTGYRFFFSCDDYDYLENDEMVAKLDVLFNEEA